MGGLLNRDGFQPAWATVCFWSSSLFVFANRQRAHAAAAAVNGLGEHIHTAGDDVIVLEEGRSSGVGIYLQLPCTSDAQLNRVL